MRNISNLDLDEFDLSELEPVKVERKDLPSDFADESLETESDDAEKSRASGRYFNKFTETLISKICGIIADEDSSRYKLSREESEIMEEASEDLFEEMGWKMNPVILYMTALGAVYTPLISKSISIRNQKRKATKEREQIKEATKKAKEIVQGNKVSEVEEETIAHLLVDYSDTQEVADRRIYFKASAEDSDYYYYLPDQFKRAKKEEKTKQRISIKLKPLIERNLSNAEIIKIIYGGEKPKE